MPQVINTNIASLNAQRNLNQSQADNQTALQRLSSGLRINSAKDDAAGLAISTRFDAQIEGTNVAIRNSSDAISLSQTAEGALKTVTDALLRIRELALQSANGTYDDIDREALNSEAQQLIDEVQRTSETTNFNGRKLLDGSFDTQFQVGANAGETIDVTIGKLTTDSLGGGDTAGISSIATDEKITKGDLVINGVTIQSSVSSSDSASFANADASSIAKSAAINEHTDETNVVAEPNTTVAEGTTQRTGSTLAGTATSPATVQLNGVDITVSWGGQNGDADRASVIEAINAKSDQTGIVAVDSGSAVNGIFLEADDGRNITITGVSEAIAEATGLPRGEIANQSITPAGFVGDYTADTIAITFTDKNGNTVTNASQTITLGAANFGGNTIAQSAAALTTIFTSNGVDLEAIVDPNNAANILYRATGEAAASGYNFTITGNDASGGAGDVAELFNNATVQTTNGRDGTYEGGFTLYNKTDGGPVTIDGGDGSGSGDLNNVGLVRGEYETGIAASTSQERIAVRGPQELITSFNGNGTNVTANGLFDFNTNNATFDFVVQDAQGNTVFNGDNIVFATDLSGAADLNASTALAAPALDVAITAAIAAAGLTTAQLDVVVTGSTDGTGTITYEMTGTLVANGTNIQVSDFQGAANADINMAAWYGESTVTDTVDSTEGTDLPQALDEGDLVLNGVVISASRSLDDTASDDTAFTSDRASSGIALGAAINRSTEQTGVTATVNPTEVTGGSSSASAPIGSTGTVYINGVQTSLVAGTGDSESDRLSTINAINAITGQTGVVAEDNGTSITLTAEDGRNISVAIDTNDTANGFTAAQALAFTQGIGLDSSIDGIGSGDFAATATYINAAETTYSTLTLTSAEQIEIGPGSNGPDALTEIGFNSGEYGGATEGTFIKDIDISTVEGAVEALAAIDNAVASVNFERANLGAYQNRFESTIESLSITSENLSASNSRIRDADFAAETAELSRTQVLQQAGISVLSQANAQPEQVLSLLQ
ncbi:flagellin [Litoribacillus peritrichatus]|uniref:Flagellin n=1 Tax=Litoribacillus peritrichatus TaxID=718191 RepID=A0ABP7M4Q7_9GAMM